MSNRTLITNFSTVRSSPKWSFGATRRGHHDDSRDGTPGPGAYSSAGGYPTRRKGPSYGFGTSQRSPSRASSAPGPGQYAPPDRPRAATPTYGFGTSKRGGYPKESDGAPGPGSYTTSLETTRNDAPKFSGTPRRYCESPAGRPLTPGPGSYQSVGRPDAVSSPQWRFGTTQREKYDSNNSPGPGAYANAAAGGSGGPKYTMRSRPAKFTGADASDLDTPGPGAFGGMYTQFG